MTVLSDDPHEESETLNEALSVALRKHYPDWVSDFSTFDPHRINFFMKEIFKVSRSHTTDKPKLGKVYPLGIPPLYLSSIPSCVSWAVGFLDPLKPTLCSTIGWHKSN
jgi:hypothetical protein